MEGKSPIDSSVTLSFSGRYLGLSDFGARSDQK